MGKLHQITRKVNFMLGSFEGTQRSEVNYIARKIVPDIDYTYSKRYTIQLYIITRVHCDNCVAYTACTGWPLVLVTV